MISQIRTPLNCVYNRIVDMLSSDESLQDFKIQITGRNLSITTMKKSSPKFIRLDIDIKVLE